MAATDQAYEGFDIQIGAEADEGGFTTLAPGEYPAVVGMTEKEHYSGSDKMPPCPMVIVHFTVDGGAQGMTDVTDRLYLTVPQAWKIKRLFTAVGLVENRPGVTFTPDWNALPGRECILKIGNREYNGNVYNDVKDVKPSTMAAQPSFSFPQPAAAQPAQPAPAQPVQPAAQPAPTGQTVAQAVMSAQPV